MAAAGAAASLETAGERKLSVLHFNDVYHLGDFDTPTGGARSDRLARFWHRMRDFEAERPLVIFGGDFLAPSLESAFTKGKHMMEALELLGVHVGTLGNHDFDFGVPRAQELLQEPVLFDGRKAASRWVLTNITAPDGSAIAGCEKHLIVEHEGVKVGFLGLSEDWLAEAGLNSEAARWRPEVEAGREAARALRAAGAELLLCIMHSNVITMEPVVEALKDEVDFFFGGHEHIVAPKDWVSGRDQWVISGWEFEEFSVLRFRLPPASPSSASSAPGRPPPPALERVRVPAEGALPEDPKLREIKALVAGYDALIKEKLQEPVCPCGVPLECRKFMLRTQETAAGNLLADVCMAALRPHGAEIGYLISGAISSHQVWPAGDLTMETVVSIFPWEGAFVLLEISGRHLLEALEHGASLLPRRYGRFPQVAGVAFAVDVGQPVGSRISEVTVAGEPLDPDRAYLLATTDYAAQGGDEYEVFLKKTKAKVSDEFGPGIHEACRRLLPTLPPPKLEGRIRHKRAFRMEMEEEELAEVGDAVNVAAWK